MNNIPRVRILALHHDALVCTGVTTSLRQHAGFDVLEGLPDAQRAPGPIDVVIADYQQSMRLLDEGVRNGPLFQAKILALTSNDREMDVRRALEAGIHGYLLLGGTVQDLVEAVRALARGERRLDPTVVQRLADSLARTSLTSREVEVLRLVTQGESNKLIARQLGIQVGTVKTHTSAILAKLNASSRTQAAAIAMSRGLLGERRELSTRQ